jgi:eukaryotic-like serine/threonine-protein kinase
MGRPQEGSQISHYRIISCIGAGGMGEVYLAEDTTLGRRVALKLLPAHLSDDKDRLRRFEQEARAASALNHPNIITIHEVGVFEGARFIATEFIEGETLRQHLKRGPMTVRDAVEISIQVANALTAAHNAGIIHRDIKPENVMLRPDGYVKVLDFGIVKLTEKFSESLASSRTGESISLDRIDTESNIVMGSPNYMSPEQARGLLPDNRTDIFSLGVTLYEIVAGRHPFLAPTVPDIVAGILDREPPPLSEFRSDIPTRLQQIINKSLAKDRSARYQTAAEMLGELRKLKRRLDIESGIDESVWPEDSAESSPVSTEQDGRETIKRVALQSSGITATHHHSLQKRLRLGGAILALAAFVGLIAAILYFRSSGGQPGIESIAVLPFVNETSDPNTEYLADGITESVINNLAQSPGLKVMSRNAVFRFKGQEVNTKKVGRELSVQSVLWGRVTTRGERVAINVELVDARDETQVWGQRYDRGMSDIVTIQQQIAREVSQKLQLKLTREDERRVNQRYTDNAEAYQLYLKGRFYWNKRTEEALKRGIDYFNQAIALDQSFALAYAGLADCYALLVEYSSTPPQELYPKVKAAAQSAIAIDDSLAEAYTSLAAAYEYEWNWTEAENNYRRAIQLNTNYQTAHHWYAAFLSGRLRHDEALAEIKHALELEPASVIINTALGRTYYCARKYDLAIEQLKRTLDMDQNFPEAHFNLGLSYEGKGLYQDAIRELQKSVELFNDRSYLVWVARVYAEQGKKAEAQKLISETGRSSKGAGLPPYPVATVYAALGENDQAFQWLERVYSERSYYVVYLNVDPILDSIRRDSRFNDLLKRTGVEP